MMMPITLMDVAMLQLFIGWLAQTHNFDVEMQLIARQGMVEVQADCLTINTLHTRVT